MLHGTLWDKIPRFAVPVAATAILSQLFNAADIAVIGNFTGELRTVAVAAVGTNSSIISLIVNLFIGIALGAFTMKMLGSGLLAFGLSSTLQQVATGLFLLLFIGISQNQNVVFEKRALRKKAAEALAKQQ